MSLRPSSGQAKSLPTAPNLEHLKKQAKDLCKSHRTRNPECCAVLKLLRQFNGLSDSEIFETELSLNEAQMALALDYGFKSWGDLKKHVLGRTDNLKYLHIHCGDSSGQQLRNSSVPGDVFVWREIYIEGPAPGGLSDREFSIERAKYLANWGLDPSDIFAGRDRKEQTLAEAGKYEEVVLWFDACMFDQAIMIKVIDQCSHQDWGETKFSLICVGEFPGFEKFNGLGELNPEQLESLMDQRHEITAEEISLAQNAWKAFTSANPADVEALLAGDTSAFPYLKAALTRHLEQYPSVRNGLNRTQNQILQAVIGGATKLGDIFVKATDEEPAFMGDSSCWDVINELASCKEPMLDVSGPESLSVLTQINPEGYNPPSSKQIQRWDVSITNTGKETLAGKQDFIKLSGIDKWLGGTHLQGPESQWRWDENSRRLVKYSDAKPADSGFVNEKTDDRDIPVIIKKTEPTNLLYVEYEGVNADSSKKAIDEITQFIKANDLTKVGHVMCIYPSQSSLKEKMVAQIPVAENVSMTSEKVKFKQEGPMEVASIFWRRSSGDIDRSLDMLKETIREKGQQPEPSEGFRQVYHNSPINSKDPVAELQVRIQAAKEETALSQFFLSMADYLDKGIPLFQMLEMLRNETSSSELRNAIGDILEGVKSGNTISQTMDKHKKVFPPTVISLIRDGERLGKLEITTRKAAEWVRDGSYTMDEEFLLDDTRAAAIRQMLREGLDCRAKAILLDPTKPDSEKNGPEAQSFRPILVMPDGKETPWKMWILTKQTAEIERELKEQTLLDAKQSGDEMKGTLKIRLHGKEKPASEFPVFYKPHEKGTIIRISLTKKTKGGRKMDIEKLELKWNGHKFDTFSQIVVAAGKMLGKELKYEDVSTYATSNFAPSIQINESCTDWWHMNKRPAMDLVGRAAGLKFENLEYPKNSYTEWTDEEVEEWHGICAPVIKQQLDEGKILITEGGWSNPKGKPFYPWCFWGIVTNVDENGTILGLGVNNRDDNEMKWISECWIVSVDEQNQASLDNQLFERALTRIRGNRDPYQSDKEMAFGLTAMDIWIDKMKAEHFCDDCFKSAPDREWTCARGSALTMSQGAKDVAEFLKEMNSPESAKSAINEIIENYTAIADLLEPALDEESDTAYQKFIGNRQKQKEHAETVLIPVKEELSKAGDEIEKILEVI